MAPTVERLPPREGLHRILEQRFSQGSPFGERYQMYGEDMLGPGVIRGDQSRRFPCSGKKTFAIPARFQQFHISKRHAERLIGTLLSDHRLSVIEAALPDEGDDQLVSEVGGTWMPGERLLRDPCSPLVLGS
jgi:hypothetical protein